MARADSRGPAPRTAGADRAEPVLHPAGDQAHPRRIRGAGRRPAARGRLATRAARAQPDRRAAAFADPRRRRPRRSRPPWCAARPGTIAARVAAVARVGRRRDRRGGLPVPPPRHGGDASGRAVARAFGAITQDGVDPVVALGEIPAAMAGHDPGETVRPLRPAIPVVAVTGTNGKTTTTRLIAHLVKAGGRTPGWSSTDGIVIDGGWWRPATGPGRAARPGCLRTRAVQVAVTETARGGILLRGRRHRDQRRLGGDQHQRRPPRAARACTPSSSSPR